MLKNKVLLKSTRDKVIRITPPLTINRDEINSLLRKIINVTKYL